MDTLRQASTTMPFTHLPAAHTTDDDIRRAFIHTSSLLADVYTMLGGPTPDSNGGACNFPIALVLACIVDGLATEIDPVIPIEGTKDDAQFIRLRSLMSHLRWGDKRHGWITLLEASKVLWLEIRNPLAHNLGADTHPAFRRGRRDFTDTAVVHHMLDRKVTMSPDEPEAMTTWPALWPVMFVKPEDWPGPPRFVVSLPALYWHVKELAWRMAEDDELLTKALQVRKKKWVKPKPERAAAVTAIQPLRARRKRGRIHSR